VGSTWEELLEAPNPEELARALEVLARERDAQTRGEGAVGAGAAYEAARGGGGGGGEASSGRGGSSSSGVSSSSGAGAARESAGAAAMESGGGGGGGGACCSGGGSPGVDGGGGALDIVPHAAWAARLRALLAAHPAGLVGEVGVDRAAVIPGTKARVRFDHQLALLREQLALAAELRRPVSVHCVRGYGHLLALFAGLPGPAACPPAVMLHSYGGSPEEVARFTRLPDIGPRFYFSFSSAINARSPTKLAARLRAVPDDRLLLESDQVRAVPPRAAGARAVRWRWEGHAAPAGRRAAPCRAPGVPSRAAPPTPLPPSLPTPPR
jgi:Tat protein secretion system quality control protein TatD with DNase activity